MAALFSRTVSHRMVRGLAALACLCMLEAAHAVQVTEEYSYSGEVSQNEACRRAEERAKRKAIAAVLGEVMSSDEQLLCRSTAGKTDDSCEFNRMSWSSIDEGEIRSTKEIARASAVPRGPNAWACVLTLDIDVVVPNRKPNPNFQLGMEMHFLVPDAHKDYRQREKLLRSSFHPGDDFMLRVSVTEPAHLALFSWLPSEDNKVYRIDSPANRPNCPTGGMPASDTGTMEAVYCLTARWSDAYTDSKKPYYEWLIVVASKTPQKWLSAYEFEQFKAVLREMPLDQRRVVQRPYQLMK